LKTATLTIPLPEGYEDCTHQYNAGETVPAGKWVHTDGRGYTRDTDWTNVGPPVLAPPPKPKPPRAPCEVYAHGGSVFAMWTGNDDQLISAIKSMPWGEEVGG
jgi:hypothetical protein